MIETVIKASLDPLAASRVFGGHAPQKTQHPYIVFNQMSNTRVPLDAANKYDADRWDIKLYAGSSYTEGRTLARAAIAALELLDGLVDGHCIYRSTTEGPTDEYDPGVEQHYQSVHLLIDYSE